MNCDYGMVGYGNPIMMLQINTMMCGESASPGVRYSRVQQNISGLPNMNELNEVVLKVQHIQAFEYYM